MRLLENYNFAGFYCIVILVSSTLVRGENTSRNNQSWMPEIPTRQMAEKYYLPDFSYAGYHWGEVPLPQAKGTVINVTDFGAIPDDGKDDTDGLKKDCAAAHKVQGPVVLKFPEGKFILKDILYIERSDLVLKGASSGVIRMKDSTGAGTTVSVTAKSNLDIARPGETIVLKWSDVQKILASARAEYLVVTDQDTGQTVPSQGVDLDGDGITDELIFQSDFAPKQGKVFSLRLTNVPVAAKATKVHAMFVPTRYDDFAWENDRIAFRVYGPGLQNTDNLKEKLTSSGIDVWAKRVRYPVIEKWYSPTYKSYHEDSGEGLDFYKVGTTRGCGGIGIRKNGKMYLSENFVNWKIIADGPIRVIFELTYNPWDVDGVRVSEVKRVTLDAGSNLNRFDSTFKCDTQPGDLTCAIGIALAQHPGGTTTPNKKNGWLSFWEPSELNGALGCAVVIDPAVLVDIVSTEENNLVLAKARSGEPATYYAGAGWQRSGDFAGIEDWNTYLEHFARRLASPLEVLISSK